MRKVKTRRTFLAGTTAAGALALAGCTGGSDDDPSDSDDGATDQPSGDDADDGTGSSDGPERVAHEVWALDQGTDTIYLYEPTEEGYLDGSDPYDHAETIDLNDLLDDDGPIVPHMIDYSGDYAYAAIACTAGARTLIFRTEDHELVADLETGAGSHMAAFSPDDEYVHVDAIGEEAIVRVDVDLDAESFEIVDELAIHEDETVQDAGIEGGAPICHQYAPDGRSLHTLGPSYHDGALVIVDHESFSVERAYGHDEYPTNCGTMPHPTEEKFYLTAGLPSDPDSGEEGVGDLYIYDTAEDELRLGPKSTGGIDAHGFWFTPDGEELWVLNRETNDGIVWNPDWDQPQSEIEAFGPATGDEPAERDAPDIMWATPDGAYMLVTLRGPAPLSGDPHAATGVTPGFSILDTETKEIVTVVEPDPIDAYDDADIEAARNEEDGAPSIPDFHGIGVRPLEDVDAEIGTSPPY
ncbi:YncE family protein [Halovivax gelatinilyticus]|uniref:YncE family protein n=1 Tax=Halovivax gelatinilyticus TaxID=2961597 RepID=UPI0020CA5451|nr:cell surface protein [Halovivax gelatinilyticus]